MMLILKPSLTLARRHLRALPRLPTEQRETRRKFKANRSSSSQAVQACPKARRLVIATARFRQRARAGESSAALARAPSASHPRPGIDTLAHGPLRPHGHRQVGDAEGAARRHPAAGGHPRARRGRRHHRRNLLRHAAARLRVQVPGRETLRRACPTSIHHPRPALTALAAASRARFRRQPSAGRHFFVR